MDLAAGLAEHMVVLFLIWGITTVSHFHNDCIIFKTVPVPVHLLFHSDIIEQYSLNFCYTSEVLLEMLSEQYRQVHDF